MSEFVWSYSALDSFEQCPYKFYGQYILKMKSPPTPALVKGRAIHKAIEDLLTLKMDTIPALINKYRPLIDAVVRQAKGKKLCVEMKMGLNGIMEPVGFFDDHVWGRGAADFIIIDYPNAFIGDWKDGKEGKPWSYVQKYEKPTQLIILALFVLKHFPRVENITACNVWLEHGRFGEVYKFSRKQEAALWQAIMPKIQAVENAIAANNFCKTPSPLCAYCPVTTCEHNRS